MPDYELGDIVMASIADPNGRNEKLRPVVILTPSDEIADAVIVAAISSSQIPSKLPDQFFDVPWHRNVHPRTGLDRRSVIKADWLVEVRKDDIERKIGAAPGDTMRRIAQYLDGLD